jgi:hypothetical protein
MEEKRHVHQPKFFDVEIHKSIQEMLSAIRERGLTHREIGEIISRTKSSVCRLASGDRMDVGYTIYLKIKKLHELVVEKKSKIPQKITVTFGYANTFDLAIVVEPQL